jgi:hypothetical protein
MSAYDHASGYWCESKVVYWTIGLLATLGMIILLASKVMTLQQLNGTETATKPQPTDLAIMEVSGSVFLLLAAFSFILKAHFCYAKKGGRSIGGSCARPY